MCLLSMYPLYISHRRLYRLTTLRPLPPPTIPSSPSSYRLLTPLSHPHGPPSPIPLSRLPLPPPSLSQQLKQTPPFTQYIRCIHCFYPCHHSTAISIIRRHYFVLLMVVFVALSNLCVLLKRVQITTPGSRNDVGHKLKT